MQARKASNNCDPARIQYRALIGDFFGLFTILTINSVTTGARELNRTSLLSLGTHNAKGEMREI